VNDQFPNREAIVPISPQGAPSAPKKTDIPKSEIVILAKTIKDGTESSTNLLVQVMGTKVKSCVTLSFSSTRVLKLLSRLDGTESSKNGTNLLIRPMKKIVTRPVQVCLHRFHSGKWLETTFR
jgi:hypothetical protein